MLPNAMAPYLPWPFSAIRPVFCTSCEKISKGIEACDQTALSWDIPYELLGIFIKIVQDCSLTRSFL
jgi:hypothetical protein